MLLDHFTEHGYVRIERAFAPTAPTMAAALWAELERRHGIVRGRPETWTVTEPRGLGALRRAGAFDALATPTVVAAIDELLGHGWPAPFSWGDPLVTFPRPGEWRMPRTGWHIDFPARSTLRLKWLGYLAPVGPGGGGTVVLAGSHRRVADYLRTADPADPGRSSTVRDAVLDEPADDGRAVELTGEPGDVVFLHPHLFHAPAPNHSTAPRLMVTGGLAG
jgi:hypothetical protein